MIRVAAWLSAACLTVAVVLIPASAALADTAPATQAPGSGLGNLALIVTAVFGGVAGIIGAFAQLLSVPKSRADDVATIAAVLEAIRQHDQAPKL